MTEERGTEIIYCSSIVMFLKEYVDHGACRKICDKCFCSRGDLLQRAGTFSHVNGTLTMQVKTKTRAIYMLLLGIVCGKFNHEEIRTYVVYC